MFELHDKQHKELSERLKHVFEEEMRRQGIGYEYRITRSETGTAADGVLTACLGAELLVAGQPDPDDPATNDETADTIVFNSSCPVLLVPYAPVLQMVSLDRIVVAFNGKREAARAAFDALPLMKHADRTEIVWIDPPEIEGEDQALASHDIAESISRHGINVTPTAIASNGRYAQDALREHIIAERADLLVMGAYSHSRLRAGLWWCNALHVERASHSHAFLALEDTIKASLIRQLAHNCHLMTRHACKNTIFAVISITRR